MRIMTRISLALACTSFVAFAVSATQTNPPQENKPPAGIEVQTRGPVHEAFLQLTDIPAAPGEPVPKKPPQPIPEMPPEFTPEGNNIQFISGYWAWDGERKDHIWVSGVQRNVPAGKRWVPGYWTEATEGWRWVSGFWAPEEQEEIPYTPEPPATLENGPSLPGPDDSTYVPGHWAWRDSRFVWRPGYYAPARLGRIWVQPRYSWTPCGYVFVDGYWDYPIEDRGLLYAPVYFTQRYWDDPSWCYQPSYWVRHSCLLDFLFYRPLGCHFYFGNWYGAGYAGLGFFPWFGGPCHFDPCFSYYRWCNRGHIGWHAGLHRDFNDRCHGLAAVPANTLVQQTNIVNNNTVGNNNTVVNKASRDRLRVVEPLRGRDGKADNVRLTKTDAGKLELGKKQIERNRELANSRAKTEAVARVGGGKAQGIAPSTTNSKLPNERANRPGGGDNIVGGNTSNQPRVKDNALPRLKDNLSPQPKVANSPRFNDNPSSQPKVIDNSISRPRISESSSPAQPKGIGNSQPQPRVVDNPAPKPRFNDSPAPRISSPSPAPRISSPSPAPRISSPSPAPRISSPSPAPRISSPSPAPRMSSPAASSRSGSAPRPSGGGSRPGGGGGARPGRGR